MHPFLHKSETLKCFFLLAWSSWGTSSGRLVFSLELHAAHIRLSSCIRRWYPEYGAWNSQSNRLESILLGWWFHASVEFINQVTSSYIGEYDFIGNSIFHRRWDAGVLWFFKGGTPGTITTSRRTRWTQLWGAVYDYHDIESNECDEAQIVANVVAISGYAWTGSSCGEIVSLLLMWIITSKYGWSVIRRNGWSKPWITISNVWLPLVMDWLE